MAADVWTAFGGAGGLRPRGPGHAVEVCSFFGPLSSGELSMDNVRILMPVVDADPHLTYG